MQEVELHAAWSWDCDNCGRENFCRGMTIEFPTIEEQEAAFRFHRNLYPGDPLPSDWRDFECLTFPETVECEFCEAEYEAITPTEGQE